MTLQTRRRHGSRRHCARSQGYTHALAVRFESRASLEVYIPHPAHQRVIQGFIAPVRADTLVVDYEI